MATASRDDTLANLLAYLDLCLDSDLERGLAEWQRAYHRARQDWQLQQAGQLLHQLKHYPLAPAQRATVLTLEANWLAQQARWPEAAKAYERSLSLRPNNVATLSGLGNALRHIPNRIDEAIARQQQALALADSESRPDISNNLGLAYYQSGRLDDAQAVLLEARTAYQANGDRLNEASALHNLGSVAWTRGNLKGAEEHFSSALQLYRDLGQRHAEAETLNSLGLVQEAEGRWDEAAETYRSALSLLQLDGDDYGQAQVLANLGNVLTLAGDYAGAEVCFEGGLAIARSLANASLEGQLLTGLAELQQAHGKTADALAAFQQSLERKRAGGETRSLKHTWLSLGALYHRLRQPAEAQDAYTQALNAARDQGDRRIETHALIDLAKLALTQSQPAEAANHLDAAEPLATASEFSEALADIAQLRGDLELLKPEADYHALLQYYASALAYAHDFNLQTLQAMQDYLTALIRALAEDGQPEAAAQMATHLGELVAQMLLPSSVQQAPLCQDRLGHCRL